MSRTSSMWLKNSSLEIWPLRCGSRIFMYFDVSSSGDTCLRKPPLELSETQPSMLAFSLSSALRPPMAVSSLTHASTSRRRMNPVCSWSRQRHANSLVASEQVRSLDALISASPAANSGKVIMPLPSWSKTWKTISEICFTFLDLSHVVLATCASICARESPSPSPAPMSWKTFWYPTRLSLATQRPSALRALSASSSSLLASQEARPTMPVPAANANAPAAALLRRAVWLQRDPQRQVGG
mmetsp:Transcript_17765/g.52592  ORF Transcript_17765/g.52592 Transcript_17765/m.52592 type:complete len:241 (-) Transcript_17765:130-852(-)